MSENNNWTFLLGALAVAGFIWAINENKKRTVLENQLKQKDKDYLELLSKFLEKKTNLPAEIKNQLLHLRNSYIGIQDDIAIELHQIIKLIDDNLEEIAIEKLTKVVENLLQEKFVNEKKAKDRRSCPKLYKMLESAVEFKWISKQEFFISNLLKDERNEEAHKLATIFPSNWKYISFLSGIELIYNLKGIKRQI